MRNATMIASLALLLAARAMAADKLAVVAGPITNPANGHIYYKLVGSTWTNSEATAIAMGGHLVTVRSGDEQAWLVSTFGIKIDKDEHSIWIGLRQNADGRYVWAGGEKVDYTHWGPLEPNSSGDAEGEFIYIGRYANGGWNDTNNSNGGPGYGPLPGGVVEIIPPVKAATTPASRPGNR